MNNDEYILSTTDNPWNPYENYDAWYAFDTREKGYGTTAYWARVARTSDDLSDKFNNEEIDRAADEIIAYDLIGKMTDGKVHYIKVYEKTKITRDKDNNLVFTN